MSDGVEISKVELDVVLNKITTTVDGGWRITFDCGNENATLIALLAQLRDQFLTVEIKPNNTEEFN